MTSVKKAATTKFAVSAVLAASLSTMSFPAMAAATSADDGVQGAAAAATAAQDVLVLDHEDASRFLEDTAFEDVVGKWYSFTPAEAEYRDADPTVRYMVDLDKRGNVCLHLDGHGAVNEGFPIPGSLWDYTDEHGIDEYEGTLSIGAGITALDGSFADYASNVVIAEGSQLRTIGGLTFRGATSINLKACKRLEEIKHAAFVSSSAAITVPASVRTIGTDAFLGVDYRKLTVLDPKNTPITDLCLGLKNFTTSPYLSKTVKRIKGNKIKLTWKSECYTYSKKTGTFEKTSRPVETRYKVWYRPVSQHWEAESSATQKSSMIIPRVKKGTKYWVTVLVSTKNDKGKWGRWSYRDETVTV